MKKQEADVINISSKIKKKKKFKCTINWVSDKFPLEVEAEMGLEILDHSSQFLMIKESENVTYYINSSNVLFIFEEEIKDD